MSTKNPSVLFICTGNICRSPMAEALFRAHLRSAVPDWQRWRVESAGTWAADGEPVSRNSQLAMARRGLDVGSHTARIVDEKILEPFDLVLTMEPGHKEALLIEFPFLRGKVFTLKEMVDETGGVDDPYGGPLEEYEETAAELERIIQRGMQRIVGLAVRGSIHQEGKGA